MIPKPAFKDPGTLESGNYLRGVRPAELSWGWGLALPHLSKLFPRHVDQYRVEDFLALIEDGKMQLWLVYKDGACIGCAVTEVINVPTYKYLSVTFSAGVIDIYDELITLEHFARQLGCRKLVAPCRPGVAKLVADRYGFKERCRMMELELWDDEENLRQSA